MRLAIVGATGRTGTHLLNQAVDAGHDVTAVVRSPSKLDRDVRAVRVDFSDPDREALTDAVRGADAALSCMAPRARADFGLLSRGTRTITDAMARAGTKRFLILSGAGVATARTPNRPDPPRHEPGAGWIMRHVNTPMARVLIGKHFVDAAVMEDDLAATDLDYTTVNAPLLLDRPLTGAYKVAYGRSLKLALRIGRADVAHFMLRAIDDPAAIRTSASIAY
jgi:nucleoside-diphosphate-sugar epimerase